ncbi:replication-relaxation family protein [Peribacillus psychrosaccharolyticus]|uniref:Replication-relaxation family protein n=1 Tax=Peribacillus psychrosaccharolyticus TaxID=1407 RepID=A0A974NP22_PERPY|nr:replication-relaxation family protein [Peribacillus psychrosaccharolyticus]MEC2057407.1 replication-relaxation family protein [Peribacillus psychrosaccharolyticus]MED3742767.1 replication-relaxation family protein [Peribacillus psychrosaccharolyticus]QQT01155.1 replication-relaxation family protein [Peribacillus psychrosaccharolyticus]
MLTTRDKRILEALTIFRCMTRDQIKNLFFRDLKNPVTAANSVLKRLRRDDYIEANTQWKPYTYFLNPSTVKKNSQKISHYLAIVDFYIELCESEKPTLFHVEQRYGSNFMQPDIFMVWKNRSFFVEIQRSRYTTRIMEEKLERYINYFRNKGWYSQSSEYVDQNLPSVWIVSKSPYHVSIDGINIIQTSNVKSFLQRLFSHKEL